MGCEKHIDFRIHAGFQEQLSNIYLLYAVVVLRSSLYRTVINYDANTTASMVTLSTTERSRAISETFVHLINYVFVLKAAWLDCLIMY